MTLSIERTTAVRAYEKVLKVKSLGPPKYKDLKPDVEEEKPQGAPLDDRGKIIDVIV